MTVREMLAAVRSGLKQIGKLRYKSGTTTGAGSSDGSTLVSTSFGGVDDAWNEAEARITSGDNADQRREVGDWVNSTGTATLVEAFTHLVATSVTFEIGEKGFVSDHEIIVWLTMAQDELIVLLVPDAFPGHSTVLEVAGTNGVSAALPANLAGPPKTLQFKDVSNVERDVVIVPPGEKNKFTDHAYLGSTLDDMVAIFEGGLIKYRPVNNGTLLLPVIPRFDDVSFSAGSALPTYLHPLQVQYAVYKGWLSKERLELANANKGELDKLVASINAQYGNVIRQMETKK